jgi:putative SOS response-associated peptidase YedK
MPFPVVDACQLFVMRKRPFTSFSEYDTVDSKKVPVWFAAGEERPLLAFAGLWTHWTSVRKAR